MHSGLAWQLSILNAVRRAQWTNPPLVAALTGEVENTEVSSDSLMLSERFPTNRVLQGGLSLMASELPGPYV